MPASSRRGKQKPGGMWVGTLVVVIIALGGLGVAGYFWSRSSASMTAQKFVELEIGVFTSNQPNFAALKKIVRKADIADIERAESAFGQRGSNPLASLMGDVKYSCEVQNVSMKLKEATVKVKTTLEAAQFSRSIDVNVILVREGLAWKVNAKQTIQGLFGVAGTQSAPQM